MLEGGCVECNDVVLCKRNVPCSRSRTAPKNSSCVLLLLQHTSKNILQFPTRRKSEMVITGSNQVNDVEDKESMNE